MEILNAPEWVFFPGASVKIGEAARMLGVSVITLKRHMESLGLSIYRHPTTDNRHFLISEIKELKELLATITATEAEAAKKNGKRGHGILRQVKR